MFLLCFVVEIHFVPFSKKAECLVEFFQKFKYDIESENKDDNKLFRYHTDSNVILRSSKLILKLAKTNVPLYYPNPRFLRTVVADISESESVLSAILLVCGGKNVIQNQSIGYRKRNFSSKIILTSYSDTIYIYRLVGIFLKIPGKIIKSNAKFILLKHKNENLLYSQKVEHFFTYLSILDICRLYS